MPAVITDGFVTSWIKLVYMLVKFVSLEGTMQVSLVARSSAVFEVSHIGRSFTRLHPELVHPTAD
jgi:hypothetical protein